MGVDGVPESPPFCRQEDRWPTEDAGSAIGKTSDRCFQDQSAQGSQHSDKMVRLSCNKARSDALLG